jgi:hypothetical protein
VFYQWQSEDAALSSGRVTPAATHRSIAIFGMHTRFVCVQNCVQNPCETVEILEDLEIGTAYNAANYVMLYSFGT